ncbi:DMT family transporter [Rubripirellula amarantea]|nr:DMT family transporter [Rubripirellula amarantea]
MTTTRGLLEVPFVVGFSVAYACLMKAMRTGDVSAVTPFRYSRLLFGVGLGVFWFQETLSSQMMAGSTLIIVSGLIIISRRS